MVEIVLDEKVKSDEKRQSEIHQEIRRLMEKLGINNYCTRYVSKEPQYMASCGEGIGTDYRGTLGALAKTLKIEWRTTTKSLSCPNEADAIQRISHVALFSRHFATKCEDNKLNINSNCIQTYLIYQKWKNRTLLLLKYRSHIWEVAGKSLKHKGVRNYHVLF